jgi:integrase
VAKPKKPYKSFPLTPHNRGGWAKKYKGHALYIADRDPDKALAHFHRIAKRIDAGEYGLGRAKRIENATVYDVCNRYVYERGIDRDAGKIKPGTWADYDDAATEMVDCFGKDTLVEDVTQDDFTRLQRRLERRLGTHATARMVQNCRTIWNHADSNGWIERKPKYGTEFKKPLTEKRKGQGFTIEQALALIACAYPVQLEAMLLLMVNGGYTAKDCADLPRAAVDLDKGIVRFPRPKMKGRRPVDRVMTMWPETAEALREVLAERADDVLVFRTAHGNPWVQGQTDSVRLLTQRIIEALGWTVRGPSWLRHLHRTLADELEKPHAAARLMGHRLPGLAEVYVDRIEHSRVQQITDHIRSRLFPSAASAAPSPPVPSETSPSRG